MSFQLALEPRDPLLLVPDLILVRLDQHRILLLDVPERLLRVRLELLAVTGKLRDGGVAFGEFGRGLLLRLGDALAQVAQSIFHGGR